MNPWDKLPAEPSLWYDRFDRFYRALGPARSIKESYRRYYNDKHGIDPDRNSAAPDWYGIADQWKWKERAESWDEDVRQEIHLQERDAIKEMTKKQTDAAHAIWLHALDDILKMFEANTKVDMGTLFRMFRQASDMEARLRGLPSTIPDIYDMSPEDLRDYVRRKLQKGGLYGQRAGEDGPGGTEASSDSPGRDGGEESTPSI